MRYMILTVLALTAGCAQSPEVDPIAQQVAESKAAFAQSIPDTWSPGNFPVRVISDYKSKGARGIVAMDMSNTITTFEICARRTTKCFDTAAKEAVANCENTVHLGLRFNILNDITPKCRVVIVNDRFVHRGKITVNGVEFKNGDKI